MTVSDGGAHGVLGLAHIFALVLGEDLDDNERALAASGVHFDLEVLTGTNRLTVEVPSDLRRRCAPEEDAQLGAVAVVDRLVAERQSEARRFLVGFEGLLIILGVQWNHGVRSRQLSGWNRGC